MNEDMIIPHFDDKPVSKAEKVYQALMKDFGFQGATGKIVFTLKDYPITVEQNNVVGNILEEWLDKWLTEKGITHIHNHKQASPDFWLNPDDLENDWLEIKSFTGSPNFDIAASVSYTHLTLPTT